MLSIAYMDQRLINLIMLFYLFICHVFQQIVRPLSNPIKKSGHIQILYGNLAPEGSVAKITGKEGLYFSGTFPYTCILQSFVSFQQFH